MVSLMSKLSYDPMPKASITEATSGRCHGLIMPSRARVDLNQKAENTASRMVKRSAALSITPFRLTDKQIPLQIFENSVVFVIDGPK